MSGARFGRGDLFEDQDWRQRGRTIRLTSNGTIRESAAVHIEKMMAKPQTPERDAHIERVRARRTYFSAEVEAHPKNPDAIGRTIPRISEATLVKRFKKISR